MKDLMDLLEKETIEIPETEGTSELDQDLANQATEVLGYTKLQTAIQNKTHALARVIKQLGIETLKKESVKTYQAAIIEKKRQEVIATKRPIIRFLLRCSLSETVLGVFTIFLLILSLVGTIVGFGEGYNTLGNISALLFTASLLFLIVCIDHFSLPTFTWRRVPLDGKYAQEVSEFALARAIAIKEALPSAQIFVEECAEVKDPFLVAVNGDEEYYFAVYDEPEFEANL